MATTNVESQRLISLSLGKIAQSRSQKGGINLHKNLLVATVLHKARTACMMEIQRQRQLEFQQRQQQLKDAAALEFQAQQEQARSAALSLAAFNTCPQPEHSMIPTCVREMEEQEQACDTQPQGDDPVTPEWGVNVGQSDAVAPSLVSQDYTRDATTENEQCHDTCNKENSPPVQCVAPEHDSDLEDELDVDFDHPSAAQVVPQSSVMLPTTVDHLAAATQLSEDSALSGLSSRKSQTSAAPTCNVLKRQRENWVNTTSQEQECPPATKKARLVASASRRDSSRSNYTPPESDACSYPHTQYASAAPCSPDCNNQISNLVSIFNSGFTGLCAVSSLSPQASNEDLSSSSLDLVSSCDTVSGQYAQSDNLSISSSLSCSSSLGRMDTIPSALGLVLSV